MGSGSAAQALLDTLADGLAAERGDALRHACQLVRNALPPGYEEVVSGKMIAWVVPLSRYPATYNGQPLPLAALAAQKNHNALYLTGLYSSAERTAAFAEAYKAAGKKLDMGKSCVRFRTRDELCDEAITEAIASIPPKTLVADYEAARKGACSSA